jgi:methylase of polypeptide subunit release factors
MHHEIMLGIVGGKLHVAPVKDPQRILDIGTGTGIWVIGNQTPPMKQIRPPNHYWITV